MAEVNFNIVEGDDILDRIQDDFLELYANKRIRKKDICRILGITSSQFQNLRMRLVRRGLIKEVRNPHGGNRKTVINHGKKSPKNYFWNRRQKKWNVKYHSHYYACFKEEEHAKRFVELMREIDWDFERRYEIKRKVILE